MAIKFVDKGSEDGTEKVGGNRPTAAAPDVRSDGSVTGHGAAEIPGVEPQAPEDQAAEPHGAEPQTAEDAILPGLVHPKPEPKPRGRKKPLSAVGTAVDKGERPAQEPAEALLPGLQVHAKPPPKPRGRKKAFG